MEQNLELELEGMRGVCSNKSMGLASIGEDHTNIGNNSLSKGSKSMIQV